MTSTTSLGPACVSSVTVLELGTESSCVQTRDGAQILTRRKFSLGVDGLVRHSMRHDPPKPIELEHAIDLTEEAVMPLAAQFGGGTDLVLHGMGATLLEQGLDAGGNRRTVLTLDEVEVLFNRLAAVSLGRPATQEPLPTDARFFAALLILREFMHHLQFANVTLQPSRDPK